MFSYKYLAVNVAQQTEIYEITRNIFSTVKVQNDIKKNKKNGDIKYTKYTIKAIIFY